MQLFSSDSLDAAAVAPPADAVLAWARARACDGADGWFDLGIAWSTGSHGVPCDFVEAHKWFNIAASHGHHGSAQCRADLAGEMTMPQIADAQRRAREWLKCRRPAEAVSHA